MVNVSPGIEILHIAIEAEKNGRRIYEVLESNTKDTGAKEKLKYLLQQEKRHEAVFKDMSVRLSGDAGRLTGSEEKYLKEIASTGVFEKNRVESMLKAPVRSDIEALEIGIVLEKDAILFYSEMRGMLPHDEQSILDSIVEEEKKHLSEIIYLKSRLIASS